MRAAELHWSVGAPLARNMDGRADVLVLGGGLFGSAAAYHIADRTHLRVTLYDGSGERAATPRAAGILTPVGWDPWDLALVRYSAREIAALGRSLGRGEFRRSGGLRLSRTDAGAVWLRRVRGALEAGGLEGRSVGPKEVADLAPGVDTEGLHEGLYTPDDATFDAAEVARGYATLARRLGVEVVHGEDATLLRHGSAWRATTPAGTVEAPRVVVACGADTKSVLAGVGIRLPIAPFRSQAALLRPRPLAAPFPTLHDLDLELYLRDASWGRVIAGDGTEHAEADPRKVDAGADAQFLDELGARLRSLVPGWSDLSIERSWSGCCVASPDRFPLVGRAPRTPGLLVATGFNGLGAMRAPALARQLAEAIATDVWEPLGPADPGRFSADATITTVRPEFPLEDDGAGTVLPAAQGPAAGWFGFEAHAAHAFRARPLATLAEIAELDLPHLSEWFDPFLRRFLVDALATGGEAAVAEEAGHVVGLYLYTPAEGVGSVFTRRRAVASAFLERAPPGGVYAESAWRPYGEPIEVMAADLRDWAPEHPYRNPVRIAGAEDLPGVERLMEELTGGTDPRWFATLPRAGEICFLAEVAGRVAGVSWSTVVGAHARGHSFMVHPRYRGLGIGTDLLQARMAWLKANGVAHVVSEIYEGNDASRIAAERAGMARVGRMFHYRPREPAPRPRVRPRR